MFNEAGLLGAGSNKLPLLNLVSVFGRFVKVASLRTFRIFLPYVRKVTGCLAHKVVQLRSSSVAS